MVTNRYGEVLTPHEAATDMMARLKNRRERRREISETDVLLAMQKNPERMYRSYVSYKQIKLRKGQI